MISQGPRKISIPLELLEVPPGLQYRAKLPESAAAEMIKVTKKFPRDRMKVIQDGFKVSFDRGDLRTFERFPDQRHRPCSLWALPLRLMSKT